MFAFMSSHHVYFQKSTFLEYRCAKPNLVETYIDSRRFPVRFDDTDTMVSEKILNHEEFDLTIKYEKLFC